MCDGVWSIPNLKELGYSFIPHSGKNIAFFPIYTLIVWSAYLFALSQTHNEGLKGQVKSKETVII